METPDSDQVQSRPGSDLRSELTARSNINNPANNIHLGFVAQNEIIQLSRSN